MLLCRGTVGYTPARDQINQAVTGDFAAAAEYVTAFEDLRKIYTGGQNWDFASWATQQRCVLRSCFQQPASCACSPAGC